MLIAQKIKNLYAVLTVPPPLCLACTPSVPPPPVMGPGRVGGALRLGAVGVGVGLARGVVIIGLHLLYSFCIHF